MENTQLKFAKAIAHEIRQEMMTHLCCNWLSVSDLAEKFTGRVNQPTVSHHLKILEEAKLVHVRREGKYRYYTLNQEMMTTCCGMLVRNYAPDYAAKVVLVDAIPVVGD